MKISMDGLRKDLTGNLKRLRSVIESINDDYCDSIDTDTLEGLMFEFDTVAQSSNILNCVYDDESENFSDLSDLYVDYLEEDQQ